MSGAYLSSRTCDPKIALAAIRVVFLALEWITHVFYVTISKGGDCKTLDGK